MYRVAKKTRKNTQNYCLSCKYCKTNDEPDKFKNCFAECIAPNKVIIGIFNTKDFYCKEYKNFNEMSEKEKNKLIESIEQEKEIKAFKEYAKKYFDKKKAKILIAEKVAKKK